jgi:polysaccharide deacetylase 2 family uncharacterized protein YibQ
MKHVKQIISIILLIVVGVTIYLLWIAKKDYTSFGSRLDNVVMEVLFNSGINDVNIISQYRQERRDNGSVWIETVREIEIPAECDIENLRKKIEFRTRQIGARIYSARLDRLQEGEILSYELGKDGKILQRLKLKTVFLEKKIKIAVVIDDLGYENKKINKYFQLNIPVTFTILPDQRYSLRIAQMIKKTGHKYLLHLPMEPGGYPRVNPGEGAILTTMSDFEIEEKFYNALNSISEDATLVPVGVSNHMGSKFTSDLTKMKTLLQLIKNNNLFFFDSYTTAKSVGKEASGIVDLPYLKNNVFLDNVDTPEEIEKQFMRLLKIGKNRGYAVGLGHINRKYTLEILENMLKVFQDDGCEFVYLDTLIGQDEIVKHLNSGLK